MAWYLGWQPFTYASRFSRLARELRASFGEIGVAIVETFEDDPLKQVAGEDRHVIAFVTSAALSRRAAVRSKQGAGDLTDIGRGLGALFGGAPPPGAVLGDPTFEQHFDVTVASREDGAAAVPLALRQLLLTARFRGALETRQGGMVVQFYGVRTFEPARLDEITTLLWQVHQAFAGG